MTNLLERHKDSIIEKIERLRNAGVEGEIKVAPVQNIRCFAPCNVGMCVCRADFDEKTIVSKEGYQKAMRIANENLSYVNEKLEKFIKTYKI